MSKSKISKIMAQAIDFGRCEIDRCVVAIGDRDEPDCIKVDGWLAPDDIKRAYFAIFEQENKTETLKSKLEEMFYNALNSGIAISQISFETTVVKSFGYQERIVVTNIDINSTRFDLDKKAP